MTFKSAIYSAKGRGALSPTTAKTVTAVADGYILFSVATNVVRVEVNATATATTGVLYPKDDHYRIDLKAGDYVTFIDTAAGASAVYYNLFF